VTPPPPAGPPPEGGARAASAVPAAPSVEDPLEKLRDRITRLDDQLIRLIGERRALVLEVGRVKADLGLPVMDPRREAEVVRRAATRARELGVDEEMTRDVIWRIMAAARAVQEGTAAGAFEPPPPPWGTDAGEE